MPNQQNSQSRKVNRKSVFSDKETKIKEAYASKINPQDFHKLRESHQEVIESKKTNPKIRTSRKNIKIIQDSLPNFQEAEKMKKSQKNTQNIHDDSVSKSHKSVSKESKVSQKTPLIKTNIKKPKSPKKESKNNHLVKLDLEHIWHPCTQMKEHEKIPLIPIKKAKGIYLYDFDGKAYMDCVSSWWVNLFGHCNPYIAKAIKKQLDSLEHTLLAGFSHKPIISYSSRLCALLPKKLTKCFYADNGSSAVEVALKMSFAYHQLLGEKRPYFLSLSNSYHGETLGALSVGDVELYKKEYKDLLIQSLTTPVPKDSDFSKELASLKSLLEKKGKNICAFILEPLVQCAGSMHIYSKDFIKEACKLCKQFGIHIIFDEIAVGFGRSGSMFALEQCEVVPDFLCLSKGITGGFLPLSVVVTHNDIYKAFYAPYESHRAFLHSHSYTGNALALAAANAVLDIFEKEDIIKKNRAKSAKIFALWQSLDKNKKLGNFRHQGMIFAFDILQSKYKRAGMFVYQEALRKGLLLRPLGNTIYLMPPYIIKEKQVVYIVQTLEEICQKL